MIFLYLTKSFGLALTLDTFNFSALEKFHGKITASKSVFYM